MSDEPINAVTVFAAVPVKDLEAAIVWYSRLFNRGPDDQPSPTVVDFYLASDRDPHKGTLQLVADPARAGGGLVTVNVSDIDAVRRALDALEVKLQVNEFPITAISAVSVLVGATSDPDGNGLTFVEARR